jgi:prophage regulatory protein
MKEESMMNTKVELVHFLSVHNVAKRYQVSKATIWRWTQNSCFPDPVKLIGCTRWRLADIEAWEKQQAEAA